MECMWIHGRLKALRFTTTSAGTCLVHTDRVCIGVHVHAHTRTHRKGSYCHGNQPLLWLLPGGTRAVNPAHRWSSSIFLFFFTSHSFSFASLFLTGLFTTTCLTATCRTRRAWPTHALPGWNYGEWGKRSITDTKASIVCLRGISHFAGFPLMLWTKLITFCNYWFRRKLLGNAGFY